jgi:hypothetical protein
MLLNKWSKQEFKFYPNANPVSYRISSIYLITLLTTIKIDLLIQATLVMGLKRVSLSHKYTEN